MQKETIPSEGYAQKDRISSFVIFLRRPHKLVTLQTGEHEKRASCPKFDHWGQHKNSLEIERNMVVDIPQDVVHHRILIEIRPFGITSWMKIDIIVIFYHLLPDDISIASVSARRYIILFSHYYQSHDCIMILVDLGSPTTKNTVIMRIYYLLDNPSSQVALFTKIMS